MLCTDCQSGYHAPYDRFERMAANPEAPSFLMRCKQCTALWNDHSGVPELLARAPARWLYPLARIYRRYGCGGMCVSREGALTS